MCTKWRVLGRHSDRRSACVCVCVHGGKGISGNRFELEIELRGTADNYSIGADSGVCVCVCVCVCALALETWLHACFTLRMLKESVLRQLLKRDSILLLLGASSNEIPHDRIELVVRDR